MYELFPECDQVSLIEIYHGAIVTGVDIGREEVLSNFGSAGEIGLYEIVDMCVVYGLVEIHCIDDI